MNPQGADCTTWQNLVEAQAETGRYANTSDYSRDLIRRDQDRRQALAELEAEIDKALASGPAEPRDALPVRLLPRKSHMIVWREADEGVGIIRSLHARRDWMGMLPD